MMQVFIKKTLVILSLFAVVIGASLAVAQSVTTTTTTTVNDLGLSQEACRYLTAYKPGADGSAAYEPGVDVTGKPVVEADIGGSSIPAPDEITFDLSVDMAQYLGLNPVPRPEGFIDLGIISVLPDGTVLHDGQPLESQAESDLRALCYEQKAP